MNTVSYSLYNGKTKLWYKDSIDTEHFMRALAHFNWFKDVAADEDITEARIILYSGTTTCARYTKSNNPVW